MRLVDKLRQLGGSGRGSDSEEPTESDKRSEDQEPSGSYESLPGGASGEEAAGATPQRAAELAD